MDQLPDAHQTVRVVQPITPVGLGSRIAVASGRTATPNQTLAIVCVGIVLANLDLFIVNVALPDTARDFGNAALDDLSWVLNTSNAA